MTNQTINVQDFLDRFFTESDRIVKERVPLAETTSQMAKLFEEAIEIDRVFEISGLEDHNLCSQDWLEELAKKANCKLPENKPIWWS